MFKKVLKGMLSFALLSTTVFQNVPLNKVVASEGNDITVEKSDNKVLVGNEFISREFSINDGKLLTSKIMNHRAEGGLEFIPADGSEEFVIKFTKEVKEFPALDRTGWTAVADSYHNASGPSDGPAQNLLDGDVNSIWHSNYGGGTGKQNYPYNVLFNLNGEQTFQSFSYTPRQQGENTNGNILGYQLYGSNTEEILTAESEEWELLSEGEFLYDGVSQIVVDLAEETTANQLKLVALSSKNGQQFGGGAEFNLHADKKPVVNEKERSIRTSDLTLKDVDVENTTATINNVLKTGKKVTFAFEPYEFNGVELSIDEVVVMYEGDHFMRKFMEISIPEDKKADIAIDYIDLEHLFVNETDSTWTIPTDAGGVVSVNQYKANLGQPVYIQGMFMGCEFPVADTQIQEGLAHSRYYTGKTFERFELDNQLTQDGKYVTWQTVFGAARSTEMDVIQTDFFSYIDSIATPSDFRIQYNSWFDNMMLIDDENILESFIEIDRELSKTGVRPLDSYVMDDGWNNYHNTSVFDPARSGTTLNQTGFWEFNTKFPNGLTPSSTLVQNFGSNFGIWVGPRGGYNYYGHLADILIKSGKGSKAGGSIDVADREYVKNFQQMACDWQRDYKVNYWKWDGFADDGQFGQFAGVDGVPGYANRHMTGGYQNMYHVTDLWEAWIDLFEAVRQSEIEDGVKNLWISLTCYVNPSPWYLQWANSVWLQCVGDRGESGPIPGKMDKMLTYRDSCYYDFIKAHQFQFPLANIYNHDPIYGTEGTGININSMTDEQFKNYLYMMGTRGTAFWELYYSDSIMTKGKYQANAEFLKWAEENFHILRNVKMFGQSPANGVKLNSGPWETGNGANTYGFSAWDGNDGIISMRNADTIAKDITFTLDRNLGLSEELIGKTLYRTTIHTYNMPENTKEAYDTLTYGDTVTITLQPGETRIWSLSTTKDEISPEFEHVEHDGKNTITVRFNEKVNGQLFSVEGKTVTKIEKSVDNVTYEITVAEPLVNEQLTIVPEDIKDLEGNKAVQSFVLNTHKNNVVLNEKTTEEKVVETSIDTTEAFSMNVQTTPGNKILVKQGNDYVLGVDKEGKPYATVNGKTIISDKTIMDGEVHSLTLVRENNDMVKLYVDGQISVSVYDKEGIAEGTSNTALSAGLDSVMLFDKALGYDEVAKLNSDDTEEETDLLPTDSMSISVSGTSEGSATNDVIFDGDPTTFWTSEYAENGIQAGNPNMVIDLGGEFKIHQVDYTKRFYNSSANIWKCTGNLREYVLEISDDGGETWQLVSEGVTLQDEDYTSKGDGGTTEIAFDEVKATHIRLSGTASYHWQESNINKYMTVADLAIYGEKAVKEYENIALKKPVKIINTEDGTPASVNKDRPANMATDGVIGSDSNGNYADFGRDNVNQSIYLEVDLGEVEKVEGFNLYRYFNDGRIYNGTVVAVSETEDFSNPTVLYNSDKENFHGLGEGTDALYAETSSGKTVLLEKSVNARYARVYMHGSNKGTTNHVVEFEVLTEKEYVPSTGVDASELIKALIEFTKYEEQFYTTDSYAELQKQLKVGYDAITSDSQEVIDEALAEIQAINVEEVLVVRGNVDELAKLIAEYSNLNSSDYEEESWTIFEEAFNAAKELVNDNSNISQNDVDKAYEALTTAFNTLERMVYTVTVNGEEVYTGAYNDKVTVTAPVVEGKTFTAWLFDGKVISTEETYTFFLSEDMELTPCYEAVEMNAEALLTNTMLVKRADNKADIKFVAQLVVPTGYTVTDAGLVWSSKEGTELSLENTNLKPTYITKISTTNQFSVTIKGMPAGRFIRGRIFATLVDGEGNETVVYSEEARVVNK